MKKEFDSKQETVTITTLDGMSTVQICTGEEVAQRRPEEGEPYTAYLYDFTEWTAAEEDVDEDAIRANPEEYVGYTPAPELTTDEKAEKALANSEYAVILAGGEV